jgi:hypothetical protein
MVRHRRSDAVTMALTAACGKMLQDYTGGSAPMTSNYHLSFHRCDSGVVILFNTRAANQ